MIFNSGMILSSHNSKSKSSALGFKGALLTALCVATSATNYDSAAQLKAAQEKNIQCDEIYDVLIMSKEPVVNGLHEGRAARECVTFGQVCRTDGSDAMEKPDSELYDATTYELIALRRSQYVTRFTSNKLRRDSRKFNSGR